MGAAIGELAQRCDALPQGRVTYQVSSKAWPERSGDVFSDWINGTQKYVVSETLSVDTDIAWKPTTITRGRDLAATVSKLREGPGGDICVYGSLSVVRALLAARLVDELGSHNIDLISDKAIVVPNFNTGPSELSCLACLPAPSLRA